MYVSAGLWGVLDSRGPAACELAAGWFWFLPRSDRAVSWLSKRIQRLEQLLPACCEGLSLKRWLAVQFQQQAVQQAVYSRLSNIMLYKCRMTRALLC